MWVTSIIEPLRCFYFLFPLGVHMQLWFLYVALCSSFIWLVGVVFIFLLFMGLYFVLIYQSVKTETLQLVTNIFTPFFSYPSFPQDPIDELSSSEMLLFHLQSIA